MADTFLWIVLGIFVSLNEAGVPSVKLLLNALHPDAALELLIQRLQQWDEVDTLRGLVPDGELLLVELETGILDADLAAKVAGCVATSSLEGLLVVLSKGVELLQLAVASVALDLANGFLVATLVFFDEGFHDAEVNATVTVDNDEGSECELHAGASLEEGGVAAERDANASVAVGGEGTGSGRRRGHALGHLSGSCRLDWGGALLGAHAGDGAAILIHLREHRGR